MAIQLFDSQTASLRVLDSSASTYSNLAWRKDSADLATLKSKTDDKHDGSTYVAVDLEPPQRTLRVQLTHTIRPPTRNSHRGSALYPIAVHRGLTMEPPFSLDSPIGIQSRLRQNGPEGGGTDGDANGAAADNAPADDQPTVDVWHWRDTEVMAHQVKSATQNGRRNLLAAWHIDSGSLTPVGP